MKPVRHAHVPRPTRVRPLTLLPQRLRLVLALAGLAWLVGPLSRAADAPDLSRQLAAIARFQFGQNAQPLAEVEQLIRQTQDPTRRRTLERQIAGLLTNEATWDARQWACRQLWFLGSADSVPALSRALGDEKLVEMACYALGNIPGPETTRALCGALSATNTQQLVPVINVLGERRSRACVSKLGALASANDPAVAAAALLALGKIGGAEAAALLPAFRKDADPGRRRAALEASLHCAEAFVRDRQAQFALPIYRELAAVSDLKPIQRAGLFGLANVDQPEALRLATALMATADDWSRATAVGMFRLMPSEEATKQLAAALPAADPETQLALLDVLTERDLSARPALVESLRSPEARVRAAALAALGKIGDVSALPLFVEAIASAPTAPEKSAAQASLRGLPGEAVDLAIVGLLAKAPANAAPVLIQVLADRNAVGQTSRLLALTSADDAATRRAAFKAVGRLAASDQLPAIIERLIKVQADEERDEAEQAVVEVARKFGDPTRADDAVLLALTRTPGAGARASLLRVAAALATPRALRAVAGATRDPAPAVADTAIRELANWPSATALGPLETIFRNTPNRTHRTVALRGYLRLLSQASDLGAPEKLRRYREVSNQTRGPNEMKLVLAGLATVADPEALKIVAASLNDPAIGGEAAHAAVQISRSLYASHPSETRGALEAVLKSTGDATLRQQAEAILKLIEGLQGYLTAWETAGPFTAEGKNYAALFDTAFAPENAEAKNVAWVPLAGAADAQRPWLMDLLKTFGGEQRVAYAHTYIFSEQAQPARLELGSDDGVKVWLNGQLVHSANVARPIQPGSDKLTVNLKAGWNPLLLKITQNNLGWEFCARLTKPDGSRLEGVRQAQRPDGGR